MSFSTFGGIKFLLKCTKKPDFGKYFLNQARMAQPLSAKNGKLKEQSATIQPKTQIPKISQELNFALKLSSKPSKNWVFKEIWSQNHEKNGQFWFKNLQTFGKLRSSIAKLSFSERSSNQVVWKLYEKNPVRCQFPSLTWKWICFNADNPLQVKWQKKISRPARQLAISCLTFQQPIRIPPIEIKKFLD